MSMSDEITQLRQRVEQARCSFGHNVLFDLLLQVSAKLLDAQACRHHEEARAWCEAWARGEYAPQCPAAYSMKGQWWACRLPQGHKGVHVAYEDGMEYKWQDTACGLTHDANEARCVQRTVVAGTKSQCSLPAGHPGDHAFRPSLCGCKRTLRGVTMGDGSYRETLDLICALAPGHEGFYNTAEGQPFMPETIKHFAVLSPTNPSVYVAFCGAVDSLHSVLARRADNVSCPECLRGMMKPVEKEGTWRDKPPLL